MSPRVAATILVASIAASGCYPLARSSVATPANQPSWRTLLAQYPTADPRPHPGYQARKKFPWRDTDHNHCRTRDDVLHRQLREQSDRVKGRCATSPTAGTLDDPYTGLKLTFPADAIEIDHIRSRRDLWDSGAWAWTQEARTEVANAERNLVATQARINGKKSDQRPAEFLSSGLVTGNERKCQYIRAYVAAAPQLPIRPQDKAAMLHQSRTCPD